MKLVLPSSRAWRLLTLMIFTAGLFGCDYASKSAAKERLAAGESVEVAPALLRGAVELRYVENDDIAWNALRRAGVPRRPAVLLGLSAVAAIGLAALVAAAARRRPRGVMDRASPRAGDPMAQAALVLVVGGALGNVVDRAARGYVVDFIHVKGWPVFNVADVAIVAGMALLLLAQLRARGEARTGPPE